MVSKKKPYTIVLIKDGETIPQRGLDYETKEEAQKIADYMTAILPDNLRIYERYSVVLKTKLE